MDELTKLMGEEAARDYRRRWGHPRAEGMREWLDGFQEWEPHERHDRWPYFSPFDRWLETHPRITADIAQKLRDVALETMWAG